MLNVSTKAKKGKSRKKSSIIKNYLGMFILAAIYYFSVYGFNFNLKEVRMNDFMLFSFVTLGFIISIGLTIFKIVCNAIKKFIDTKVSLLGGSCIDSSLTSLKFKDMMKKGEMTREQTLSFKNQLKELLTASQKKKYSKYEFQNDAHEIYFLIKNKRLKSSDHMRLLKQLEQFQKERKQLEGNKIIYLNPQTAK